MLPRVTDLVRDIMMLMPNKNVSEEILLMILDFCDAFWNMPLSPAGEDGL